MEYFKTVKWYHPVPVVLSENEVNQILAELHGVIGFIVQLLYGSGLRISVCLRLRILDLDFDYRQIEIRNAKGAKDRITMMPERLRIPLRDQINKVQFLHKRDLSSGMGEIGRAHV